MYKDDGRNNDYTMLKADINSKKKLLSELRTVDADVAKTPVNSSKA